MIGVSTTVQRVVSALAEDRVVAAGSLEDVVTDAAKQPIAAAPGAPGSALRKHVMDSHTTAEDAGRIATKAGVKMLVLSHFVPAEEPPISDEQWLAGARSTFAGRVVVGRDLLEL